ncbi:hypothetical protein [Shimazuella kribbensis]|uniref:hypothetical protein n=1 Tax=Shimazuella kribbensis TaxID=139808 RepID=UPI0004163B9F|nr:hypothetical protein [Shimazuella kribbensis]
MKGIAWICLFLYSFFFFSPILGVFAYELPYQLPQYKPYAPNIKPYIPKGVELEEKKEKPEEKKEDGFLEYVSWGNFGIVTQTLWNLVGDVMPNAYAKKYAEKNKLLKVFKTNGKGDLRIGGRKQIPYWLTQYKWLEKGSYTVGKWNYGKWMYGVLEGWHLKLKSIAFADLSYGKRYTQEEFNKTQYAKNQKAFYSGMPINEVGQQAIQQGKSAFQEAILVTKESVKKVSWWKLTGKVGLGFSALITSFDYYMDGSKEKCENGSKDYGCFGTTEYFAALPIDFGIGATVAVISAPVGIFATAVLSTLAGATFAAVMGIAITIGFAFGLGLLVENVPILKNAKDYVHGKLTSLIKEGTKKTTSIFKKFSSWLTKKIF